jgi:hypothetical protein
MLDTLVGVIIGGLIASTSPIIMLFLDHRRWQRQTTLEHLRFKRKRLEDIFRENLKRLSKAIRENNYPSDMIMDFILTMPQDVSEKFKSFLADPNKTDAKCKNAYLNIFSTMKKILFDIDNEIENIIFQKQSLFKITSAS